METLGQSQCKFSHQTLLTVHVNKWRNWRTDSGTLGIAVAHCSA